MNPNWTKFDDVKPRVMKKFIQEFFLSTWKALMPRAGALIMNQVMVETWQQTGFIIGNILKDSLEIKSDTPKAATDLIRAMDEILGLQGSQSKSKTDDMTVQVTKCPYWDQINKEALQHGLRCSEIVCRPLGLGVVKALSPELTLEITKSFEKDSVCERLISKTQPMTLEDRTCKHMHEPGHCKVYSWCPYEIGLWSPKPRRKRYIDCRYYQSKGSKT